MRPTKAQLQAELDAVYALDVKRINYENGSLSMTLANKKMKELVGTIFGDYFDVNEGENFVSVTITVDDPRSCRTFELTLRNLRGTKGPAEVVGELRDRIAELEQEVERLNASESGE